MSLPFLVHRHFLDTEEYERLLRFAVGQEWRYEKSGVLGDPSWRESRILFHFPPWDSDFRARLGRMGQALAGHFSRRAIIDPRLTEAQLTAHSNGHYFKRHCDTGHESTNARVISYVYYFFQEPRPFQGGQLEVDGAVYDPEPNSVVFFPSDLMHEVLPITCSGRWEHSRFTINGWLRHGTEEKRPESATQAEAR
jgi:hypothetical protein